jgi:hypothetical protein
MAIKLLKSDHYSVVSTKQVLLKSSTTFSVGQAVAWDNLNGCVTNAVDTLNDGIVYGVIVGIVDSQGNPILDSNGKEVTSVTTPANNSTYYAKVILSTPELVWEIDVNATLGTTAGSNKPGVRFNLADAGTVDESSVQVSQGVGIVFSEGPAQASDGTISTNKIQGRFIGGILT